MKILSTFILYSMINSDSSYFTSLNNYNSNLFLIPKENGIMESKLALSAEGKPTFGGVTGNLNDLKDFSISISKPSNLSLKVKGIKENPEICNKMKFEIQHDKIISTATSINLKTATSCTYELLNTNEVKVNSFYVLLNYTYQHWCNNSNLKLESHKTARAISPLCNISPNITSLNLLNMQISDLSPISGFYNLESLTLINNNIKELPLGIFDNFNNLHEIFLNGNQINNLKPEIFNKTKKLRNLNLSKNYIKYLPKRLFEKLNNLFFLDLSSNDIETIEAGIFDKINNSFFLDLSSNNLVNSNLTGVFLNLNNLKEINLSNNQFTHIPSEILNLTQLISLNFSDNNLEILSKDTFNKLNSLKKLELRGNFLTSLPLGIFDNLIDLESLDLKRNPINCLPDEIFKKNNKLLELNHYNYGSEKMKTATLITIFFIKNVI